MERDWTGVALIAALGVGLLVSTLIMGDRLDRVQSRVGVLEGHVAVVEAVTAEELRAGVRVDAIQVKQIDGLFLACVAAGNCVAKEEDSDG